MTLYQPSAIELRSRYMQGADRDEFAAHEDSALDAAISAAVQEIESWRPAGELGSSALAILREKVFPLARFQLHKDEVLEAGHPIMVEVGFVRDWLKSLARAQVHLPLDPTDEGVVQTSKYASPQRDMVYTDEVFRAFHLSDGIV